MCSFRHLFRYEISVAKIQLSFEMRKKKTRFCFGVSFFLFTFVPLN